MVVCWVLRLVSDMQWSEHFGMSELLRGVSILLLFESTTRGRNGHMLVSRFRCVQKSFVSELPGSCSGGVWARAFPKVHIKRSRGKQIRTRRVHCEAEPLPAASRASGAVAPAERRKATTPSIKRCGHINCTSGRKFVVLLFYLLQCNYRHKQKEMQTNTIELHKK